MTWELPVSDPEGPVVGADGTIYVAADAADGTAGVLVVSSLSVLDRTLGELVEEGRSGSDGHSLKAMARADRRLAKASGGYRSGRNLCLLVGSRTARQPPCSGCHEPRRRRRG